MFRDPYWWWFVFKNRVTTPYWWLEGLMASIVIVPLALFSVWLTGSWWKPVVLFLAWSFANGWITGLHNAAKKEWEPAEERQKETYRFE